MYMSRMKTFFKYALWIIGFFILSLILENGYLNKMYVPMEGLEEGTMQMASGDEASLKIETLEAKASNVSGTLKIKVTNTSGKFLEKCYAQIELINSQEQVAAMKCVSLENFQPDESRIFTIKFKANNIESYRVYLVEVPVEDRSGIITIFGHEIDMNKLLENGWERLKEFGRWGYSVAESVPTWAYIIGGIIVLWSLPKKYLFGIFPL